MVSSLFAGDPNLSPPVPSEGGESAASKALRLGIGEGCRSRGNQPSLFDPTFERLNLTPLRNVRVEFKPNSPVLSVGKGQLRDYDYALNPYRGCQFGCSYCYAAFFVAEEELRGSWGDWVMVKKNAVHQIARHRGLGGKRIFMSSATDPYQPIEAKLELTRGILEGLLIHDPKPRLVVQTRSPLVLRDLDLLKRFDHVRVNVSITTDSEDVRKQYEPGCPSIARRLATVRELHEAGIATTICLSPLLPVTNPARFAEQLRATGADMVVATPFHESSRPFTASTGDAARQMNRKLAYGEREFRRTMQVLSEKLASFRSPREGFCPV